MKKIDSGHYIYHKNDFHFYEMFIENGEHIKNILRINYDSLIWERTHQGNGFNDIIDIRKFDSNSNLISETKNISTTGLTIFCRNDTIFETQQDLFFPIIDYSLRCNNDTISSLTWFGDKETYDAKGKILTSIKKQNMLERNITRWFK